MTDAPLDRHSALAVPSRRRMFEALRAAAGPLDVAALAAVDGLHVTTARFHLRLLERAGLVRGVADHAGRPGRPRRLYVAVPASESLNGHRQLAGVLAGALSATDDDAPRLAEAAGGRWATELVRPDSSLSWDAATRALGDLYEQMGFGPHLKDGEDHRELELRACPFREIARTHPEVVCSVHRGLTKAALNRLGLPVAAEAVRLWPFVEPELCLISVPKGPGTVVDLPASS